MTDPQDSTAPAFTEAQSDTLAPEIMALGERIKEMGGSFVALVEFDGGSQTTACLAENAGAAAHVARYAALAAGNVDRLFMAIQKHAKEYGGTEESVYLSLLESLS